MDNNKKNICIVGGGNIGTLLYSDLSLNKNVDVSLYTSKPNLWGDSIKVYNSSDVLLYEVTCGNISNNASEIISNADIIIITLPSSVYPDFYFKIKDFIKPGSWLGFMPGSGGVELISQDVLDNGSFIFGFQRVHGIARIKEYGKSVYSLGKKNELFMSAIPKCMTDEICNTFTELLNIKCNTLSNYLNVTLTPSNPILHTTRLYSIFKDYKEGVYWKNPILFYEEWNDDSSNILLACDLELQMLLKKLSCINLDGVKSLKEHYELKTPVELTRKIKSITAFKDIEAPMEKTDFGFMPDFKSRYFTEDFQYGLNIIKSFCEIVNLATPNIDVVLNWYGRVINQRMYDIHCFLINNFVKQNGIKSIDDVEVFYNQ